MFLLVIPLALCFFLYVYVTRNFEYWKRRNVIGPKPVPLFGNIQDIALLRLTQAECLQNIYREYENEKYIGMFQLNTPTLLLIKPTTIKQFLVRDFQHFTDRGFIYDEKKEPLTANLVNLEGAKWRMLRQKLTPAFSSGKIKNMIPLLHDCGKQFLIYIQNTIKNSTEVDIEIRELTAKFTTDVIGSCAFGLNFNSLSEDSSEFRKMGQKVMQSSPKAAISKLIRIFFPTIFRILSLRTFPKEVNDFFLFAVCDTLRYRKTNAIHRDDFLQILSELRDSKECSKPESDQDLEVELTDNLIAAQAFAFFVAGFETSSTTLSFCLYELALNKHVQRDAYDEIKRSANKYGQPFGYEAIKELELLEQCLLETMRKYPPVQALARVCTKKYTIPGTRIELNEGTGILVPVYAIHHDQKYYHNPENFDPLRFTKEEINRRLPGVYMPFGDGPRICIGMRFAILEMKLVLAEFLFKYEVSPCSRTKHPLKLDPTAFILAPKNGIWLKVNSR